MKQTIFPKEIIQIMDLERDKEPEQVVQQTIKQLIAGCKTVLIIDHRLSTVVGAHHIVALSNGQIIEQGTHSELYATRGNYYQMRQNQMSGAL